MHEKTQKAAQAKITKLQSHVRVQQFRAGEQKKIKQAAKKIIRTKKKELNKLQSSLDQSRHVAYL